jgi:hypothetical protein
MVETDGFILATGASCTTDVNRLALETHSIGVICNLPGVMEVPGPAAAYGKSILWSRSGEILAEFPPSLFEPDHLAPLSGLMAEAAGFYCPGVVSLQCLALLSELPVTPGMKYIFEDPVKLMLSGDVVAAHRFVEKVIKQGGRTGYRRLLPLVAVTVNPFYPSYRYGTHDYQPAYIDRELLLSGIRRSTEVPVFDVVTEGPEGLAGIMELYAIKKSGSGGRQR